MLLAAATFLGAFLLFFLEPLIARFVLPWFGGSASVWTTCLLFFQICLLAGYAYAHALSRWLTVRAQIPVHAVLLAAAVLVLPIIPGPEWKPTPASAPVPHLLRLLTVCIGLPFLVLAATGPLLQTWFSRLRPGQSPYRLYALSNAGSLLALVSHPFLFEPWLSRTTQATGWGWAFGLFALTNLAVGFAVWRTGRATLPREDRPMHPAAASHEPTLTPSLSRPTGEGARRAGEGGFMATEQLREERGTFHEPGGPAPRSSTRSHTPRIPARSACAASRWPTARESGTGRN